MRYEIGSKPMSSSRDGTEGVAIWPYIAAGIVALNVIGWVVVVTVARKHPEPRVVVAQAPGAPRQVAQQPVVIYQQAPQPQPPLPQPSAWAQNPVQQAPAPLQTSRREPTQEPSLYTVRMVDDYNRVLRRAQEENAQAARWMNLSLKYSDGPALSKYDEHRKQTLALLQQGVDMARRMRDDPGIRMYYANGDICIQEIDLPPGVPQAEYLRFLERKP